MKLLLKLCFVLIGVTASAVSSPTELGAVLDCSKTNQAHTEGLPLEYTDMPILNLLNCTIDYIGTQSPPKSELPRHRRSAVQRRSNLVVLNVCANQMEGLNLNLLSGMSRLRSLNLGHNRLRFVTASTEVNLPALEELFLQGNLLQTLDLTNLKADRLARLYLSQNQLVTVDGAFPARFGQLQRVDLYGNRWDCEWLEGTLGVLRAAGVETLNYLPDGVCTESGSVKVDAVSCEKNFTGP